MHGSRRGPGRGRPEPERPGLGHYARRVPNLRLFASARDAAGVARDVVPGSTVEELLGSARVRYGERFAAVLDTCKIWVNGEPAELSQALGPTDEVAVLPPVSGGGDLLAPAPCRNR